MNHLYFFFWPPVLKNRAGHDLLTSASLPFSHFTQEVNCTLLHFWTLASYFHFISHFTLGKAGQICDSLSMVEQENFPK